MYLPFLCRFCQFGTWILVVEECVAAKKSPFGIFLATLYKSVYAMSLLLKCVVKDLFGQISCVLNLKFHTGPLAAKCLSIVFALIDD